MSVKDAQCCLVGKVCPRRAVVEVSFTGFARLVESNCASSQRCYVRDKLSGGGFSPHIESLFDTIWLGGCHHYLRMQSKSFRSRVWSAIFFSRKGAVNETGKTRP
jgi:hypothetical protein